MYIRCCSHPDTRYFLELVQSLHNFTKDKSESVFFVLEVTNPDHKLRSDPASAINSSLQTLHSDRSLLILQRTLFSKKIFLLVRRVTSCAIIILEVSTKNMIIGLDSEDLGASVSSSIRQAIAQFDEVIRHLGSQIRSQLKHNTNWRIIVNLNLNL